MTVSSDDDRATWIRHKEEGKRQFQIEQYEDALKYYSLSAKSCPHSERQIILSNIVACRLKIGGPAMAAAAIRDAKQCISLNERWAKGHIRLASAYTALGDHSNDVCNSLQRSIMLDPSNRIARQMLMKELRRDNVSSVSPHPRPTPTAPPEEMDDSSARRQQRRNTSATPADATGVEEIDDTEDSISIIDRIKIFWNQTISWYHDQPEDIKSLFKVLFGILVLYIIFGGRFGLGGSGYSKRGNYKQGNAYDRFSHGIGGNNDGYDSYSSSGYRYNNDFGNSHRRKRYSHNDDNNAYHSSSSFPNSFHFRNLFDGSIPSMMFLFGILYLCHRSGINPFQALWMLQFMGGRGLGRRRHMGYGMAGMGYGMARNAGMFGRRHPAGGFRRRRWY